jgi:hypothetical protein
VATAASVVTISLLTFCSDTHGCPQAFDNGWSAVGFDINVGQPDQCPISIQWNGQHKTFGATFHDPYGNSLGGGLQLDIFNSEGVLLLETTSGWVGPDQYGQYLGGISGEYPAGTGTDADEAIIQSDSYYGPVSAGIWLTWTPPPALSASFTGPAYVFVGSSGTYTATASHQQPPYTYQWQKNGVNIAGATGSTYTYSPIHPENVFQLAVRVGSANGKVATSASQGVYGRYDVGTSGPELVTSLDPPPTWQAFVNGGVGTIHYQWYFGDPPYPVGTDASSWTFDVTTNDGRFPVAVDATDGVGNVAHAEVWVTFNSQQQCNPNCESPTRRP